MHLANLSVRAVYAGIVGYLVIDFIRKAFPPLYFLLPVSLNSQFPLHIVIHLVPMHTRRVVFGRCCILPPDFLRAQIGTVTQILIADRVGPVTGAIIYQVITHSSHTNSKHTHTRTEGERERESKLRQQQKYTKPGATDTLHKNRWQQQQGATRGEDASRPEAEWGHTASSQPLPPNRKHQALKLDELCIFVLYRAYYKGWAADILDGGQHHVMSRITPKEARMSLRVFDKGWAERFEVRVLGSCVPPGMRLAG